MPRRVKDAFLAFILCALGLGHPASAATSSDANDKTAICALTQCRSSSELVFLRANDGGQYEAVFDPVPYVWDGAITIFPGEALIFRFSGTSENPGTPTFVRVIVGITPKNVPPSDMSFQGDQNTEVQHDPKTGENVYVIKKGSQFDEGGTAEEHLKGEPPGTFILYYEQAEGRPDMVLRTEHNLPRTLKFDTTIDRLAPEGSRGSEPTSTCSVHPLLAGMETWPYPIGAITLRNFRFMPTESGFNCE